MLDTDLLARTQPSKQAPPIEWALWLAQGGGWVLPLHTWSENRGCSCQHKRDCTSPAKHPRTMNGLDDATNGTAQIMKWWDMWPDANIAMRTGLGVDVIDVDDMGDFTNALKNDTTLLLGAKSFSVLTAKGAHLYVPSTGHGNRNSTPGGKRYFPGCDYRGDRGYVVAPGSIHRTGMQYAPCVGRIIPFDWNVKALEASKSATHPEIDVSSQPDLPEGVDGTAWALDRLRSAGNKIIEADNGSRNDTFNGQAFWIFRLVKGKILSERFATRYLLWAVSHHYGDDFSEVEVSKTLASAKSAAKPYRPNTDSMPAPTGSIEKPLW